MASYGYANEAPIKLDKALPPKDGHDFVADVTERDVLIGDLHLHFQTANGSSSSISHVDEIQVKNREFEVATRP